ncbi:unnamed protein product [Didymodactylos carnosus]|uniref:PDZ domain-containing protein n=1 Tax=Didymodactylos carnosus TaxID=1234261 RepID=A0A815IZB4_9BILA|nr:unnamed protein product [Didymodactylos carnosus]CAF4257955.1 unnamed protein product [Didymodactylos carnosus]
MKARNAASTLLQQSWGFRLTGGVDFRFGLAVKKVTPNSPSHNKIYPGDGLAFIDGHDTSTMSHSEAEEFIRNSLRLQLVVRRIQLDAKLNEFTKKDIFELGAYN